MDIEKAKKLINGASEKADKAVKSPGIGWEIGAYSIRTVSVVTPATVIMCLENTWVKNGLGLLATLLIIAVLIIFKEPIKKAAGYAPGVIPFAIFVVLAIFFDTTSQSLMLIGSCGLGGCVLATPLHMKYLSVKGNTKSEELIALEKIADAVSKK